MLLSGRPNTDALEWVGPVTAIGLGVVIPVATVPRRRAEADGRGLEPQPAGDGGEA